MKRGTRLIIKPINSSCGTRDRRVESGTVDKRDPDPDFPPENRLAPRFASTAPSAFPLQRGNRAIGSLPLCNRNYIYDTWRQHTDISIRIRRRLYSPSLLFFLLVSFYYSSTKFPMSRNSIYIYSRMEYKF